MANIKILENKNVKCTYGNWKLCFQWVEYRYKNKANQRGYRFIWENPDGNLKPYRGQARIPSAEILFDLLGKASKEGWFISSEVIKGIDSENT